MQKYTKTDLVDLISAKLILANFKLNKKQIRQLMKIYEDSVYELLADGIPVSFGDVGVFKFKTIKEQKERPNPWLKDGKVIPYIPTYTKIKFNPSIPLREEIKEKTLGQPFDLK